MKKITSLFVILTLLINSGCSNTTKMWKKKSSYEDVIKNYLITDKGDKVAFLGKKYHYIFDDNSGIIKKLLQWNQRQKLKINIYNFKATSSSDVELMVEITGITSSQKLDTTDEISSSDDIAFLKKLGFLESDIKDGSTRIIKKRIKLEGERYLPEPHTQYPVISSLSKEYKVTVQNTYDTALEKSKKIALTPITVTGDVITIALGVGAFAIFIAIAIPIVFVGCIASNNGGICNGHH